LTIKSHYIMGKVCTHKNSIVQAKLLAALTIQFYILGRQECTVNTWGRTATKQMLTRVALTRRSFLQCNSDETDEHAGLTDR